MAKTPDIGEIAALERHHRIPTYNGLMPQLDSTLATRGRGKGLALYDEIERDCHAAAVIEKRKLAVVAREWSVEAASDRRIDRRAAELVEAQLRELDFDQLTLNLLDALLKGFAVGETMWVRRDGGIWAEEVRPRDQDRFTFDLDGAPRLLTQRDVLRGEALPDRKFIVHSYGSKVGNPFGLGLGNKLFWPSWFKRQVLTFWLTFADRFGAPTPWGTYPKGADDGQKATLWDALLAFKNDGVVMTPEGMGINLLQAAQAGSIDTFEGLVRYLDEQMSEVTLGETGTVNQSGGGGSRAQDEVADRGRLEKAKADADLLSGTLNRSLVRWICEFNLPGATPPKVWRDFSEPDDLEALSQRDKTLTEMGFRPSIDYIRRTYGEDWEETTTPPPPSEGSPAGDGAGAPGQLAYAEGPSLEEGLGARAEREGRGALGAAWGALKDEAEQAGSLGELGGRVRASGLPVEAMADAMAETRLLAYLAGRSAVIEEGGDG